METISIRSELKTLILEEVAARGVSPSDVIDGWRRNGSTAAPEEKQEDAAESQDSALRSFLSNPEFRSKRYAIDRYLSLISFLYETHGEELDHITSLRGHSRRYFATDERSLRKHGVQVDPKRVPGTPYWAMSRLSNHDKRQILTTILSGLGYDQGTVHQMTAAFRSGR